MMQSLRSAGPQSNTSGSKDIYILLFQNVFEPLTKWCVCLEEGSFFTVLESKAWEQTVGSRLSQLSF